MTWLKSQTIRRNTWSLLQIMKPTVATRLSQQRDKQQAVAVVDDHRFEKAAAAAAGLLLLAGRRTVGGEDRLHQQDVNSKHNANQQQLIDQQDNKNKKKQRVRQQKQQQQQHRLTTDSMDSDNHETVAVVDSNYYDNYLTTAARDKNQKRNKMDEAPRNYYSPPPQAQLSRELIEKNNNNKPATVNQRPQLILSGSGGGKSIVASKSILLLIAAIASVCFCSIGGGGGVRVASAAAGSSQYFEVQPEQKNLIASGQDVRLRCLVRNRQGECHWVHNGKIKTPIKSKYAYDRVPADGDCSIQIRNANVQQDDGQWQCQVSASELDQKELESRQVNLVVLVAPDKPQIKDLAIQSIVQSATNQLQQRVSQSKLRLADIRRQMNGKNLTCVGVHQTQNQSASVELDVQYPPSVTVSQREYSIVEGSPLSIGCQVDANPAPSLVNWRLVSDGPKSLTKTSKPPDSAGQAGEQPPRTTPTSTSGPVLEFLHIGRDSNQDIYECFAQNSRGVSAPASVKLNVLFAPAVANASLSESVQLGADAQLSCHFEGNPQPEIKWFYTDPLSKTGATLQLDTSSAGQPDKSRPGGGGGGGSSLAIRNVTYRNEGDYHCEARNYINGQVYSVRSSNIMLDVYGEPQFLAKSSPLPAKAVQASRSEVALTFCSDPAPLKVYWQFGSIRLDVRLNNNGQQAVTQAPLGGNRQQHQQQQQASSVLQRFQAQPLQPIQRRDSNFAKTKTCFEATLTLLDPELTDQRDYTLNVFNERGHSSGAIRLRVSSPLSPVLMISSAFVTICGLFLCSLLFMFVFKKKQQFLENRRRTQADGAANGNSQRRNSQLNGGARLANEKNRDQQTIVANGKPLNGNGTGNGVTGSSLNGAGGVGGTGGAGDPTIGQQQQTGIVNGLGNGLANGAGNPMGASGAAMALVLDGDTGKALHMLSMASSDTSCNDQKQLLANSDRNSSTSSSNGSNHHTADHNNHLNHHHRNHDPYNINSTHTTNSTDRSTANSTPTTPMNHISVDEELNLNGATYRAAESVTQGARLSPPPTSTHQQISNNMNGLIYANLDYSASDDQHHPHDYDMSHSPNGQQQQQQQQQQPQQQTFRPTTLRRQHTPISHSPTGSDLPPLPQTTTTTTTSTTNNVQAQQHSPTDSLTAPTQINNKTSLLHRPSVGATIAMMNSLAAAASQATPSPLGAGVLNGAINQQLANNRAAAGQTRRPGPPKPPKPSIQQRSRFYQQQVAASGGDSNGLVMIGQQPLQSNYLGQPTSMEGSDNQQQHQPTTNDLAVEYSRIAFPARAEL